jgi:hypothetical protein
VMWRRTGDAASNSPKLEPEGHPRGPMEQSERRPNPNTSLHTLGHPARRVNRGFSFGVMELGAPAVMATPGSTRLPGPNARRSHRIFSGSSVAVVRGWERAERVARQGGGTGRARRAHRCPRGPLSRLVGGERFG